MKDSSESGYIFQHRRKFDNTKWDAYLVWTLLHIRHNKLCYASSLLSSKIGQMTNCCAIADIHETSSYELWFSGKVWKASDMSMPAIAIWAYIAKCVEVIMLHAGVALLMLRLHLTISGIVGWSASNQSTNLCLATCGINSWSAKIEDLSRLLPIPCKSWQPRSRSEERIETFS